MQTYACTHTYSKYIHTLHLYIHAYNIHYSCSPRKNRSKINMKELAKTSSRLILSMIIKYNYNTYPISITICCNYMLQAHLFFLSLSIPTSSRQQLIISTYLLFSLPLIKSYTETLRKKVLFIENNNEIKKIIR